MPKLYNYYKNNNIDPVPIKLHNNSLFSKHMQKRLNLISNHLKIKTTDFLNKEIIEFGCNTAENSLILAKLGGNLTLVEPNELTIPKIKKNFNKFNLNKRLKKIINKDLENCKIKKKFDYVFAEGFLNTLDNRNRALGKLFSLCNKNGSLIINYDDRVGGFIELLKSIILMKILNLKGIPRNSLLGIKIAKKLFYKQFKKLNTSRNFKAWYQDQLINPFASKTWSLNEILLEAKKKNFICFSTSPLLINNFHFQWYKNIKFSNKQNLVYKESVGQNLEYLFTGKYFKNKLPGNYNHHVKRIIDISKQMSEIIENNNPNKKIKFKKSDFNFLSKNNNKLKIELNNLINLYNNEENVDKIIIYYLKTDNLKNFWGTILHYVHLVKKF